MKLPLLGAAALSCALAACTTAQVSTATTVGSVVVSAAAGQWPYVAQAQAYVRNTCGFLPTAVTITQIAATFSPEQQANAALAETIAQGICAVAGSPQAAYASAKSRPSSGTYRGVRVRGQYVGK